MKEGILPTSKPSYPLPLLYAILSFANHEEFLNVKEYQLLRISCKNTDVNDLIEKICFLAKETNWLRPDSFLEFFNNFKEEFKRSCQEGVSSHLFAHLIKHFFQYAKILDKDNLKIATCHALFMEEVRNIPPEECFKNFMGQLINIDQMQIVEVIHLFFQISKRIAESSVNTGDAYSVIAKLILPCVFDGLRFDDSLCGIEGSHTLLENSLRDYQICETFTTAILKMDILDKSFYEAEYQKWSQNPDKFNRIYSQLYNMVYSRTSPLNLQDDTQNLSDQLAKMTVTHSKDSKRPPIIPPLALSGLKSDSERNVKRSPYTPRFSSISGFFTDRSQRSDQEVSKNSPGVTRKEKEKKTTGKGIKKEKNEKKVKKMKKEKKKETKSKKASVVK